MGVGSLIVAVCIASSLLDFPLGVTAEDKRALFARGEKSNESSEVSLVISKG